VRMLGHTAEEEAEKGKWQVAIRDALIVFAISLCSNLLTYGYPPTAQAIYSSLLTGLLMFFLSLAHAWHVYIPKKE